MSNNKVLTMISKCSHLGGDQYQARMTPAEVRAFIELGQTNHRSGGNLHVEVKQRIAKGDGVPVCFVFRVKKNSKLKNELDRRFNRPKNQGK